MGRETKILLALLATLAGIFVGVLSIKLLVPRPPAGAGVDVHVDFAGTGSNELVAPPDLAPPPTAAPGDRFGGSRFASAPPGGELPAPPVSIDAGELNASATGTAMAGDLDPPGADEPQPIAPPIPQPPRRDPFVMPAALQQPENQPESSPQIGSNDMPARAPAAFGGPTTTRPPENALSDPPSFEPSGPPAAAAAVYVAGPGDSWWGLAERAYGDGRLYRALFAWNRVLDPRVSLTPGTRLEIPTRTRLESAWPKLMPAE